MRRRQLLLGERSFSLLVRRIAHELLIHAGPLCRLLQSAVIVELILDGYNVILLLLLLLHQHDLLLIFLQLLLLVTNEVTELHLLLNQVLSLGE